MAETKEERRLRIQKEVADRTAAREKAYFEAQAKSKAEAESKLAPLPKPDVYVYDYAWRQGVGTPEGEYKLTKTPNPLYDASTNEIVDPVTGVRTKVTMSTYSGSTQTGATGSSDSLYDTKRAAGYGMDTAGNQYRGAGNSADPLTVNGSPFTGTWQGKTYQNGILVSTPIVSGSTNTGSTTKTTYTAPDGKIFTDLGAYNAYIAQTAAEDKRRKGQSAFDLLFSEFDRYGLGSLLNDVKNFIVDGLSRDELVLKLRATPAYEKRFAANAQRIKSGLRALSEAEYIGLEDQYQSIMRQYGLPQSYYARGDMGRQEGFEKFIAGDVSPVELEDRIQTAQNRITNAPKQVRDALNQFYGAELGNGDILAYVLDPEKALSQIKRKVTAAEIGGGAAMAGLGVGRERAEELGMFGVTGEQAREKFATIAEFLPTATKLGDIYRKSGMGPYNQAVAEQEVFGITGAADAATKRKKLAQLETAQFSGQVGAAGSALGRERAGQF
jgi:hypothetical protein